MNDLPNLPDLFAASNEPVVLDLTQLEEDMINLLAEAHDRTPSAMLRHLIRLGYTQLVNTDPVKVRIMEDPS